MLAAHTPLAEVFAIIREHAVAVFPDPQAGSADHFMLVEQLPSHDAYPDRASKGKLRHGHFFDGPSTQFPRRAAVLYDLASADVDSVMRIAASRSYHVRTERRLKLGTERTIAELQTAAPCTL